MAFKENRRRFLKIVTGLGVTLAVSVASIYYYMRVVGKKVSHLLPPGQHEVDELQVLHVGSVPDFDAKTWTFEVYGVVNKPFILTYEQFKGLPKVVSISDFHCVTGWSKLGIRWEGVRFRTIMDVADVSESAKFVTIECEYGYTTSLPLENLARDDVLLAYRFDDMELPPKHGGPLRIVVPEKYGYKSAKWVRKIKFTEEQELGYWETRGYSNTADPFTDDRYA